MINESSDDTQESRLETPKKKRKLKSANLTTNRQQKFRYEWQNKADYAKWLRPHQKSAFKAECVICDKIMTADISVIDKHAGSKGHITISHDVANLNQKSISSFIRQTTKNDALGLSVKRAEIKTCAFIVEHNLPFNVMNHLIDLMKNCYPDSKILENVQLKPTKTKAIISKVIGETQKVSLCQKLANTKFSILIDESTDISAVKNLCIIVRFYDHEEGQIVTKFWELLPVFQQDVSHQASTSKDVNPSAVTPQAASAEHIFNCVKSSFEKRSINLENVIGFASDGCNTMMGINNSVASRFHDTCPGITIFKCICHSMHLCASEACKQLPRTCEDLARDIYNYFNASSKRQFHFQKFQAFFDLPMHKILHPSQTRWLSLVAVVSRLLEQWTALEEYFKSIKSTAKLRSVDHILSALSDPLSKLYLLFLDWILPKFTDLNKLFQSEKPMVANMYDEIKLIYTDLLKCYMNRNYINRTPIQDIDPANREMFLRSEDIYKGAKVSMYLQLPEIRNNNQLRNDFFQGCTRFFVIGCSEIKKRFNFNDVTLQLISALKPSNAMSENFRIVVPSLVPLMKSLPRIIDENEYQMIDNEWRKLPGYELPPHINISDDVDNFWHNLYHCDNDDQIYYRFQNLSKFALNVISLPHSNAECERLFSAVNLIKTESRNKLVTSTVNGLLLAGQRIDKDCVSFEPSNDEYSRMTKNIYQTSDNKKKTVQISTNPIDPSFDRTILAIVDESETDISDIENLSVPNTKR